MTLEQCGCAICAALSREEHAPKPPAPRGWAVCTLCLGNWVDDGLEPHRPCSACKGTGRVYGPLPKAKTLWLEVGS